MMMMIDFDSIDDDGKDMANYKFESK